MRLIFKLFWLFLFGFIGFVMLNNYGVPGTHIRTANFVDPDKVPILSKVPLGAIDAARYTEILFQDTIIGAGSVAVTPEGRIYAADLRGRVWRSTDDGKKVVVHTHVGGRPAGTQLDPKGNLIITIPGWGLVTVSPQAGVLPGVLATHVATSPMADHVVPLLFAKGICASKNGTIFITDADGYPPALPYNPGGVWDMQSSGLLSAFGAAPLGKVVQFDPNTGRSKILAKKLWFASGVALSPNEDFLLIAEAYGAKLYRYWLKGKRAGSLSVFTSSLPGFPGGITTSSDGHFWVAITQVPRDPAVPTYLAKNRFVRQLVGRYYSSLSYVMRVGFILKYLPPQGLILKISSKNGAILETLHDPRGDRFYDITTVTEHEGKLYLGSLAMQGIPVIDLRASGAIKTSLQK